MNYLMINQSDSKGKILDILFLTDDLKKKNDLFRLLTYCYSGKDT